MDFKILYIDFLSNQAQFLWMKFWFSLVNKLLSCIQEKPSGFLSLNRVMSLDRFVINLSFFGTTSPLGFVYVILIVSVNVI